MIQVLKSIHDLFNAITQLTALLLFILHLMITIIKEMSNKREIRADASVNASTQTEETITEVREPYEYDSWPNERVDASTQTDKHSLAIETNQLYDRKLELLLDISELESGLEAIRAKAINAPQIIISSAPDIQEPLSIVPPGHQYFQHYDSTDDQILPGSFEQVDSGWIMHFQGEMIPLSSRSHGPIECNIIIERRRGGKAKGPALKPLPDF